MDYLPTSCPSPHFSAKKAPNVVIRSANVLREDDILNTVSEAYSSKLLTFPVIGLEKNIGRKYYRPWEVISLLMKIEGRKKKKESPSISSLLLSDVEDKMLKLWRCFMNRRIASIPGRTIEKSSLVHITEGPFVIFSTSRISVKENIQLPTT